MIHRIALFAGLLVVAAGGPPLKPTLVDTTLPTADVVVASLILEPGKGDATARIQNAIDQVAEVGGGVVFLRAGQYRIDGRLVLKEGVTLRGDWTEPSQGAKGTILALYAGRGEEEGTEFVTMERGTGLRELTFWFPEQDAAKPVPYPWVARTSRQTTGDNTTVMNVTLANAWQGVRIGPEGNELHTMRNLYMTALKTGISIDSTTDIGRLNHVVVSPRIWERSGLPGAPAAAARAACRAHQAKETTGVDMGRSDWEYVYDVVVENAAVGFRFRQGARGTTNAVMVLSKALDCGTALVLERLNGVGLAVTGCELLGIDCGVDAIEGFTTVATFNSCTLRGRLSVHEQDNALLTFQNCTFDGTLAADAGQVTALASSFASSGAHVRLGAEVARARILGNAFAGEPRIVNETRRADVAISHAPIPSPKPDLTRYVPAPVRTPPRRALYVVTDFGADPAAADNTPAFAKALNQAAQDGGGTVYVPAGLYRFAGQLRVPTGVELRGIFDVPHHTVSAGSVLMTTAGRGQEDGAPFVELAAKSGLRGLTFWYPEQQPDAPVPYPWTVRGLGPGCWLEDVTLGNSWQGVDLWTNDSTGHLVRYLSGCCLKRGLFVSKSAGAGWVEDLQFNPHYALRLHKSLPHPPIPGRAGGELIDFLRENLEGIVFGRCADEKVFATFLYAAFDGIAFRDDQGATNSRILIHGTDTASRAATIEQTGPKGLEFIAAQLVPLGKWEIAAIVTTPSFSGKASFFNTQAWAGNLTADLQGTGDLLLQQMNTLSGGIRQTAGRTVLQNINLDRGLHPHVTVEGGNCGLLACQSRRGRLRCEPTGKGTVNAFASSASLLGSMPEDPSVPGEFATAWDAAKPVAPVDELAKGGGIRFVTDAHCALLPEPADGKAAVKLSGVCPKGKHGYVYFKIADGPVAVYPDSVLSYSIQPLNAEGQHVAVDAVLDSGPPLRDHRLITTTKLSAHPGTTKGTIGEWTRIDVPLGKVSGRTIQYFMFAYDHRFAEDGTFACLLADVSVKSQMCKLGNWQIQAQTGPQGLVLGGATSPIRYTIDGSDPTPESPLYRQPIPRPKTGTREVRYALQQADGKMTPLVFSCLVGK
jgi:hypothetical protein